MPLIKAANPLPLRLPDSVPQIPFGNTCEAGKIFGFPASGLTDRWSKGLIETMLTP
jgi:hypothetical protein